MGCTVIQWNICSVIGSNDVQAEGGSWDKYSEEKIQCILYFHRY